MPRRLAALVLLSLAIVAPRLHGQWPDRVSLRDRAPSSRESAARVGWPIGKGIPREAAPLASLVVPGLGQAVLDRDRSIAYLAVETFAVLQYLKEHRELSRERRHYRSLARDVARASFTGAKPDGSWGYYEAMESYLESGEFSLSTSRVVPEPDTTTYNGSRWILARRTFWANPFVAPPVGSSEYESAIAFYLEKAVRPEFRWSWRNAALQHDLYRRSIDRANDSARRSRAALALLVANHLLSAVDALATVRLEEVPGHGRTAERRLHIAIPVGR